jgi:hypothetical protein
MTAFGVHRVTVVGAVLATALALFLPTTSRSSGADAPTVTPTYPHHGFADVPADAHYDHALRWLKAKGVTHGTDSSGHYEPGRTVTRAQMAAFLWRAAGKPVSFPDHGFSDVPADAYYDHALRWLKAKGVTHGTDSSGHYEPGRTVTRAQMAASLWRAAGKPVGYPDHGFSDVPADAYYDHAVRWLKAEGITEGVGSSGLFGPGGSVTRAQMAAFLWRTAGRPGLNADEEARPPSDPVQEPPSDPVQEPPSDPVQEPPSDPVQEPPWDPVPEPEPPAEPDLELRDGPWLAGYPGQPEPGTVIWGSSVSGNTDPEVRHEEPAGARLAVRRTFFQWRHRADYLVRIVERDHEVGRLPWVSVKTPSWAAMAAGHHDNEIDELLNALNQFSEPIWLTIHHEPEGGGGVNAPDDPAGPEGHVAMNRRVRERMTALGVNNVALVPIFMAWTWNPRSGRNIDDWWEDGIYDLLGVDVYMRSEASLMTEDWFRVRRWAEARGLDVAVGEWGMRGIDTAAGARVREWYDHAAGSTRDGHGARVVALAAYDSDGGATGGWTLGGEQLRAYHELLADPRTAHVINR